METDLYIDDCAVQTELAGCSIVNEIERNMVRMRNIHEEESQFNNELNVLIIDDDIVCLKVLSRCLRKCKYKVKATTKAAEALEILRKKEEIYDIVITDVKMNDQMDGFQLLEIIGLEMDIPVIMISGSCDKEWVMKGVRHGARDYLVKPARMDKLQNIWQHVVRKNMLEPNIPKSMITGVESEDNSMIMNTISVTKSVIDGESYPPKKPRVNWSKVLHNKFIDAIEKLGADAFPKKILEYMNEPHLSREHVASHLQKYRKWLKKEKKGTVSQDKLMNEQNINTNVVNNIPQPPLQTFMTPNKNQFLIQQNQPNYGNFFHQTPVFTPNHSQWNRPFGFNPPNNIPIPCMDSKYAVYGNGINPTSNNNYVGIPQQYLPYPNNSYDVPNFQVTISQPAPINIHTNPIIMASNGTSGNMAGFVDAPSRLDEHSSLNVGGLVGSYVNENEWIPNGHLVYQQPQPQPQQQQQNDRQSDTPIDDAELSVLMKDFVNSESPAL